MCPIEAGRCFSITPQCKSTMFVHSAVFIIGFLMWMGPLSIHLILGLTNPSRPSFFHYSNLPFLNGSLAIHVIQFTLPILLPAPYHVQDIFLPSRCLISSLLILSNLLTPWILLITLIWVACTLLCCCFVRLHTLQPYNNEDTPHHSDSVSPTLTLAFPSSYSDWTTRNSLPFTPYSSSSFHSFSLFTFSYAFSRSTIGSASITFTSTLNALSICCTEVQVAKPSGRNVVATPKWLSKTTAQLAINNCCSYDWSLKHLHYS